MDNFVQKHLEQLKQIPSELHDKLNKKFHPLTLDAGESFALFRDDEEPMGLQWGLTTTRTLEADIWILDHLAVFPNKDIVNQLTECLQNDLVRRRIAALVEIDNEQDVAGIAAMATSRLSSFEFNGEEYLYLEDEIGTRIADGPIVAPFVESHDTDLYFQQSNISTTPFIFMDKNGWQSYTLAWTLDEIPANTWVTTSNNRQVQSKMRSLTKVLKNFGPETENSDVLRKFSMEFSRILQHHSYTLPTILAKLDIDPSIFSTRGNKVIGMSFDRLSDGKIAEMADDRLSHDKLSNLIRLFCLGRPISKESLVELFDYPLTRWLCSGMESDEEEYAGCYMLHPTDEGWISLVTITPLFLPNAKQHHLLIATDRHDSSRRALGSGRSFDPCMSLGIDSLGLAGVLSNDILPFDRPQFPEKVQDILDLCCGSGVQALTLLAHYPDARAQATDLNPRAERFVNFNSHVNFLSCEFHLGNVWRAISRQNFDIIIANPPYVANPFQKAQDETTALMEKYGDGGVRGDDVIRSIVSELPQHLRPDGIACIVGNIPNPDFFVESLDLPLESVLVMDEKVWSVEDYSILVSQPNVADQFARGLKEVGLTGIGNGFLFVRGEIVQSPRMVKSVVNLWQECTIFGSV
jgi:SAM-dependent methyltransferase